VRGGEAEAGRDRGDEAVARGAAGNVGKMEGYGKNRRKSSGVAAKGAPGVGLALPRAAGTPDRILPRRGASTGAPTHLLGSPTHRLDFWGDGAAPVFGPKPNFRAGHILGGVFGAPVLMLLWRRDISTLTSIVSAINTWYC
jgi:hypothetical protein